MSTDLGALTISELAVAAIKAAGGGAALAREVGVSRFAVNQWREAGIPSQRVGKVSRITGIPPHRLRPDLFDPPADQSEAA